MTDRHLRVLVCAAGPAGDVDRLIKAAHKRSWTVAVTATSEALDFLDIPALERLTGFEVRSSYVASDRHPRVVSAVDALLVAPATFNTVNKLALGIADTYALSSVAELIGRGIPTVVVPFVNAALASRAPFRRSVEMLRLEGVRVVLGPEDDWQPHPAGAGAAQRDRFPWEYALRIMDSPARSTP